MSRRIVESPATGETFVFDDNWNEPDGRVRQLEYTLRPKASVPSHFHPGSAQSFQVVSGRLHIKVGGKVRALGPGDRAATRPGEAHSQWNEGSEPVRVMEGYEPPINMEPFFTVLPSVMESRNPFKIAVFFADFRSVSGPGTPFQKLMIAILAPVARLCGLGGWHRRAAPQPRQVSA